MSFIPGQGTKIPHAMWCGGKKKTKKQKQKKTLWTWRDRLTSVSTSVSYQSWIWFGICFYTTSYHSRRAGKQEKAHHQPRPGSLQVVTHSSTAPGGWNGLLPKLECPGHLGNCAEATGCLYTYSWNSDDSKHRQARREGVGTSQDAHRGKPCTDRKGERGRLSGGGRELGWQPTGVACGSRWGGARTVSWWLWIRLRLTLEHTYPSVRQWSIFSPVLSQSISFFALSKSHFRRTSNEKKLKRWGS